MARTFKLNSEGSALINTPASESVIEKVIEEIPDLPIKIVEWMVDGYTDHRICREINKIIKKKELPEFHDVTPYHLSAWINIHNKAITSMYKREHLKRPDIWREKSIAMKQKWMDKMNGIIEEAEKFIQDSEHPVCDSERLIRMIKMQSEIGDKIDKVLGLEKKEVQQVNIQQNIFDDNRLKDVLAEAKRVDARIKTLKPEEYEVIGEE